MGGAGGVKLGLWIHSWSARKSHLGDSKSSNWLSTWSHYTDHCLVSPLHCVTFTGTLDLSQWQEGRLS